MTWQPIETAPKDGNVLLYGVQAGEISGINDEPVVTIGAWCGRGDYDGFEWCCADGDAYAVWIKPTHWMPLPPAPEE